MWRLEDNLQESILFFVHGSQQLDSGCQYSEQGLSYAEPPSIPQTKTFPKRKYKTQNTENIKPKSSDMEAV